MKISASIVLYKTSVEELLNSTNSFLLSSLEDKKLYLIDNSPTYELKNVIKGDNVVYIHNSTNLGFGAAHNIAISKAMEWGSNYHFVINPDILVKTDVVMPMIDFMENNLGVGMMMPQILNNDGTPQNLPKLLPSPYSVLMRKVRFPKTVYNKFINKYELRNIDGKRVYEAPILSGCFTLFRVEALRIVGCYDDQFFMYFEDWDLSRRIHREYQTIYYPLVSVYHGYESGANKSRRLFKIFVQSAIKYFNKWGWLWDKERKNINKKTLKQFQ